MTRFEDYFTDRNVWALLWVTAGACLLFVSLLMADGVLAFVRWRRSRKVAAWHRK